VARLVWLGRLADLAGRGDQELPLAAPLDWPGLLARLPETLAEELRGDRVRVARNGALLTEKALLVIAPDDEIAFLPPVSGG
jgi:molybdopterin synthase sulfur carrier subunit